MSQNDKILAWLQSGKSITALEALYEFGCFRLAARINDLKNAGHNIFSEDYSYKNSEGEKKTIAKYTLVSKPEVNEQQVML